MVDDIVTRIIQRYVNRHTCSNHNCKGAKLVSLFDKLSFSKIRYYQKEKNTFTSLIYNLHIKAIIFGNAFFREKVQYTIMKAIERNIERDTNQNVSAS